MTIAPTDSPTKREPLLTPLFVLIVASGLFYFLAIGSLLPTLPRYVEEELGGSGFEIGIVVGAFAVSAALVRPTVGRLGDRFGRRAMSVFGAGVAAITVAVLGVVPAVWFLVLVRFFTGFGEAAYFVGAATAAQDLAPDDRRGEAASFFSIAIYGGLAFGPAAGEWVYRNHGADATWRVAAISCLISFGLALFIPGTLGRNANPPPRRGLLHPAAILPGLILLLGLIGFTGYAAFVPLYVDEIGLADAGPFFFAYGAIVLLVRIFGARIPDRLGAVRTSTIALTSIGVGIAIVAVFASVAGLWVGTVLLSIGMSLLYPALFILAVNNAPSDERSHAVGTFSLFFDLSQGLGAPLLGILVTVFGAERAAFFGGAAMAVIGLAVANTSLRRSVAAQDAELAATTAGPAGD